MPRSSQAAPASRSVPVRRRVPVFVLAPVPLILMQQLLAHVAMHVAMTRPELFARLGAHVATRYLIDPIDLPFVLVLTPEPARPRLQAYRRHENPPHDAAIAGAFLDLLELIDGSLDGDALFFTRDLRVTGNTEAVVALRNALDDFEGSVAECVADSLGPFSGAAKAVLDAVRLLRVRERHG